MTDPQSEGHELEEEYVPEDDAIIGTAFRWSLLAFAIIGLGVGAFFYFGKDEVVEEEVKEKDLQSILNLETEVSEIPSLPFQDITKLSGIDFVHQSGARGEKLLPETMGGGASFFDYDGDGDPDLLFASGTVWPHDRQSDASVQSLALYQNDGQGGFKDVTLASGLSSSQYCMGMAIGDYDGDGDPDVYVTSVGSNQLFRNDGGTFSDVTAETMVGGEEDRWSSSAGFFDYDQDGDLDLFVCNYVQWSREIDSELAFTLNGVDRAYGPPDNYLGSFPYLFRNDGDGKFSDVSQAAGLHVTNESTGVPVAKSLAVTFIDLDEDSFPEVLVANDTTQNFLFHNRGDGTFEEIGIMSGVALGSEGNATGAMGIDAAHFRNDESVGVGIGNFATEMSSFFVSHEDPLSFSDDAIGEGVGSPSRLSLSFGLAFLDVDLDGYLDLLQANGHLEETINEIQESQHYRQAPQLFWNAGPEQRSCFQLVPPERCRDLGTPVVGRGLAFADIEGDGDLDVLLTQPGEAPKLLRNDQELGNHWLKVRLKGDAANRDGIGSWIHLVNQGIEQRRQVMPTRSYLCQVEPNITFGLGKSEEITSLRVRWPDGSWQEVEVAGVDRLLVIEKEGG